MIDTSVVSHVDGKFVSTVPPDYIVRQIGATPEVHNGATYWNVNVVSFEGREYVISHKAILTLVALVGCNAACSFCSNEITFTPGGPYLTYDRRLDRVKRLSQLAGIQKVAFTGGEPTINPQKLYMLVRAVMPGFTKGRLHTNGYGLLHEVETANGRLPLLDALINAGLTGASISLAHFDPTVNRRVMRFKTHWQGMEEDALRRIATRRENGRFSPRLSCVLTWEGIKNVQDILDYIAWGCSLGFKRFIFRSPSGIPSAFSKQTDFTLYNRENHIDIDPLTQYLAALPGWVETYTQHKSDSHVHVYRVDDDLTVDIDESSEEEDPDDKIRRLTVMPNGVVYKSWIDPFTYVFEDDQELAFQDAIRELPHLS